MPGDSLEGRLLQGDACELNGNLVRAERFLRDALDAGAQHILLPGYDLYVWSNADAFYRTIALPRDRSAIDPSVIVGLQRAFERHDCAPRIEFFVERWPALLQALSFNGFETESVMPVYSWKAKVSSKPSDVRFLESSSTQSVVRRFLASLSQAFGYADLAHTSEVTGLAGLLEREKAVCAWMLEDDLPLAGATVIHFAGCGELQGVWVHKERRRRGLAMTVCQAACAQFAATGGELLWLSAGDRASEQLYSKLGFEQTGHQAILSIATSGNATIGAGSGEPSAPKGRRT